MKKHIKNYLKAHNLTLAEVLLCEVCFALGTDFHHKIFKSHGGTDEASNIILLCRDCHQKAHSNREFAKELRGIL